MLSILIIFIPLLFVVDYLHTDNIDNSDDGNSSESNADILVENGTSNNSLFGNEESVDGYNPSGVRNSPYIANAGEGDDTLIGGAGDDLLNGGDGNDYITGNLGSDGLIGGDGDDTIVGHHTNYDSYLDLDSRDYIDAGDGNDVIHVGSKDIVAPGQGYDEIYFHGSDAVVQGFNPEQDTINIIIHDPEVDVSGVIIDEYLVTRVYNTGGIYFTEIIAIDTQEIIATLSDVAIFSISDLSVEISAV